MINELEKELDEQFEEELNLDTLSSKEDIFEPFNGGESNFPSIDLEDIFEKNDEVNNDSPNDLLSSILTEYGISNETLIATEDSEGNEVDVEFYKLTPEEQYQVIKQLNTPEEEENNQINTDDLTLLKELTKDGDTLQDVLESYKKQVIEEYNQENAVTSYDIDNYTDDELFYLDMQLNFEDLSHEEIVEALLKEKENETLYNKKVNKLRQDYKTLEEEYNHQEQSKVLEAQEENYNRLVNKVSNIAENTKYFNGIDIELENEDKQEVLDFLLTRDDSGKTEFAKLLDKPEELFRIAWLAKKGPEAFTAIQDYYKNEITKRNKPEPKKDPKVVVQTNKNKKPMTIDDLFGK